MGFLKQSSATPWGPDGKDQDEEIKKMDKINMDMPDHEPACSAIPKEPARVLGMRVANADVLDHGPYARMSRMPSCRLEAKEYADTQ